MKNIIFLIFVILTSNSVYGGSNSYKITTTDCKKSRIELAIVMDASTSIGATDFIVGKTFLIDLATGFSIGADKSRVGLVTFADSANLVFDFEKYSTKEEITKAISEAKFLEGVTALGAGMKLAETGIFNKARSGLPKIMLVVTDGRNNRFPNPRTIANELKKEEIVIIAIGVGNDVSEEELKYISSSGNYFKVESYLKLGDILQKLREDLCKFIVTVEVGTCEIAGDISFIIDHDQANEEKQLAFVASVLNRLEISKDKQRAAIVIDGVGIAVPLDKFNNRNEYLKYLSEGDFNTSQSTENGMVQSGRLLSQDRNDVPKTAVLIKTKKINNHQVYFDGALALRKQGANIVTVAIGDGIDGSTLNHLSTIKQTIDIKDSSYEPSYSNQAANLICENLKKVFVECQSKKLDLMLVMDCSTSIGPTNWLKQLAFMSRIVSMLDVGENSTHVGAVYFNTRAFVGFRLNEHFDKLKIMKKILNLNFTDGSTAIGEALKLADYDLTKNKRKDAVPVMLLITDGESNMGAAPETVALNIRNKGVNIIVVGITDQISKSQLTRISSTNRFYDIKQFEDLDKYPIDGITKEACTAIKNEPKKECDDFERAVHVEL